MQDSANECISGTINRCLSPSPSFPFSLWNQFRKNIQMFKATPRDHLKNIYLFLEREDGKEKEGEKHLLVASHTPPTGNLSCNPGMCPDQESNQWPFCSQTCTQFPEPHQPGLEIIFDTRFSFIPHLCLIHTGRSCSRTKHLLPLPTKLEALSEIKKLRPPFSAKMIQVSIG